MEMPSFMQDQQENHDVYCCKVSSVYINGQWLDTSKIGKHYEGLWCQVLVEWRQPLATVNIWAQKAIEVIAVCLYHK